MFNEYSEDVIVSILELKPILNRLKHSADSGKDFFDLIEVLDSKVDKSETQLLNIFKAKNLEYAKLKLVKHINNKKKGLTVVLSKCGVSEKLFASVFDLILAIDSKYMCINYAEFLDIQKTGLICRLKGNDLSNIDISFIGNAISILDGYIIKPSVNLIELVVTNAFGRENFLVIKTKVGEVALPWVLVKNRDVIDINRVKGSSVNVTVASGDTELKLKVACVDLVGGFRKNPAAPFDIPFFKGAFIGMDSKPVPILDVNKIIKEIPEWLKL